MNSHLKLIASLGGPHRTAEKLNERGFDIKPVTARAWNMRASIPAKFWQPLMSVAENEGVLDVTTDELSADVAESSREEAAA